MLPPRLPRTTGPDQCPRSYPACFDLFQSGQAASVADAAAAAAAFARAAYPTEFGDETDLAISSRFEEQSSARCRILRPFPSTTRHLVLAGCGQGVCARVSLSTVPDRERPGPPRLHRFLREAAAGRFPGAPFLGRGHSRACEGVPNVRAGTQQKLRNEAVARHHAGARMYSTRAVLQRGSSVLS
jgi:hypothetical protein